MSMSREDKLRRKDLIEKGHSGKDNSELDRLNKDLSREKSDDYLFDKVKEYGPGSQAWHELRRRGKI